ncbi:hypothetical protein [Streptomyces sp. CA2R106]|uniref:hypothetical protein n=1 Tax=Streptomyces sp. CA2R106 TaxID=3120153 RepID=UPI00300B1171
MTEPGGRNEELTRAFMAAEGTRQILAVLVPVRIAADPPWPKGPLPVAHPDAAAEEAARRGLFTASAGRALYDRRWHTRPDPAPQQGPMRLDGMELLRTPTSRSPRQGLAVLHFTVAGAPLLPLLRAVSRRRQPIDPDPLSGPFAPAALLAGAADTATPAGPFALSRPYTVAFLTPPDHLTRVMRAGDTADVPLDADLLLRALASRGSPSDLPPAPEALARIRSQVSRISADWSALVLRQGAAFLGHRRDTGPGDFYDRALANARGTYLDALLLGTAQRDHIDELTDDLSSVFGATGLARRSADLERRIAVFRSTYWRQHLSAHGPANNLLLDFHTRHQLPARFEQILTEAADYARLAQNQESQQIAGALGVLTILGLPLSTALSVLQVLGDTSAADLTIALAASLAATAAALTTRYGRLVLSSLRGGPR